MSRNALHIKWRLIGKEFFSLAVLVMSILSIHYHLLNLWLEIPMSNRWMINLGITVLCLLILYIIAVGITNIFSFRQWYNYAETHVVFDNVELWKDEVIDYPNQDKFGEYLGVLCILVIPSSFLISFLITVYGPFPTSSISIEWYWWLICAIVYCFFVARPVLSNLHGIKSNNKPKAREYYPLTKKVVRLKDSLHSLDALIENMEHEECTLKNLEIPKPKPTTEECPAPYIEYVGTIADLGKSHPEVVSLEQLLLSVTAFPSLNGWADSLSNTLAIIGKAGAVSVHGISDTVKAMSHFVSNPDSETLGHLFSNISIHLRESGDSQYFKYKLLHSANKLGAFGKEGAKDAAKGIWDTFHPKILKRIFTFQRMICRRPLAIYFIILLLSLICQIAICLMLISILPDIFL